MKSAELALIAQRWLDSGEDELQLKIDQAPVRLVRRAAGVLCVTTLSAQWRGDDAGLEAALRLSAPSLGRFKAALALDPEQQRLCLMRYLEFDGITSITTTLEDLANQWDVWEAMLEHRVTSVRPYQRPALGRSYV